MSKKNRNIVILSVFVVCSFSLFVHGTMLYASKVDEHEAVPKGEKGVVALQIQQGNNEDVSVLRQKHFKYENTVYEIKNDFVLAENISIPANCVLRFNGGSISGPFTLTGKNTNIEAGEVRVFGSETSFAGKWNVFSWSICWFGASTSIEDNSLYIKKALDVVYSLGTDIKNGYGFNDCGIFVPSGEFCVASQINVNCRFNAYGNGTSSVIRSKCKGNLFVINGVRGVISLNNINFICDDAARAKCNCITLNTEQGTAIGRITNCDFVNYNVALDMNKPYWLRISSCNFVYSNEYAIKAKNANSFSILSCNFRSLDGRNASASHLYFSGNMQGVCISACDFSGSYKTSIMMERANGYGVQITGNYFEPGYMSSFLGGLIEADNCNITDLLFKANAAYESNSFDISLKNLPRYYLLLRNSKLFKSDIVGNVIVDGNIYGNANSLVGRIYRYSDIKEGNKNLIEKYFKAIEEARSAKTQKTLDASVKQLNNCFNDIQKKMVDNGIIKSIIYDRKLNTTTVFPRLLNVEDNIEYGNVANKTVVIQSGSFANRPSSNEIQDGFQYFNTDTHKTITMIGGKWWNPDGTEAKR